MAWHLNGDVGRDLVRLARREQIVGERLETTKNSIHVFLNGSRTRLNVDSAMIGGRSHVFKFVHALAMKNAPQIASFEENVLSQPVEVPSVGQVE